VAPADLGIFKKEAYFLGIIFFNSLSTENKDLLDNPKEFQIALKHLCVFTLFSYSG